MFGNQVGERLRADHIESIWHPPRDPVEHSLHPVLTNEMNPIKFIGKKAFEIGTTPFVSNQMHIHASLPHARKVLDRSGRLSASVR
jgi:hypothetical protein